MYRFISSWSGIIVTLAIADRGAVQMFRQYSRRERTLQAIILGLACLISIVLVAGLDFPDQSPIGLFTVLARTDRYNQRPVREQRFWMSPQPPRTVQTASGRVQKDLPSDSSHSFSTPFIWTFEIFLVLCGLLGSLYLFRRLRPRVYRTR